MRIKYKPLRRRLRGIMSNLANVIALINAKILEFMGIAERSAKGACAPSAISDIIRISLSTRLRVRSQLNIIFYSRKHNRILFEIQVKYSHFLL